MLVIFTSIRDAKWLPANEWASDGDQKWANNFWIFSNDEKKLHRHWMNPDLMYMHSNEHHPQQQHGRRALFMPHWMAFIFFGHHHPQKTTDTNINKIKKNYYVHLTGWSSFLPLAPPPSFSLCQIMNSHELSIVSRNIHSDTAERTTATTYNYCINIYAHFSVWYSFSVCLVC